MKKYEHIFGYMGIAAIALLLFGLAGWFIFLRQQTSAIEGAASARGFSIGIPSFLGARGSTSQNSGTGDGAVAAETGTPGSSGGSAFLRFLGIGQPAGTGEKAAFAPEGELGEKTPARRTPRFWRVSLNPVAGVSFIDSPTRLRYVERATGYLFDVDPESGDVTRITNTLIPKVYDASVGMDGVVTLHTLSNAFPATLGGKIGSTTDGVAQLDTVSLGGNVRDTAVVGSSTLMVTRENDGEHLIRAAWNGAGAQEIAYMPGGDFRILASDARVVVAEKPASGVGGSAFIAGEKLISIVRDIPGLSLILDPRSDAMLYSADTGSTISLFARMSNTSEIPLPVRTVADKCVFKPGGSEIYCGVPTEIPPQNFLDKWYRGEVHTTDNWYRVTPGSANAERLFSIDNTQAIDVENPVIDRTGQYLSFTNARDKSLWMLRIAE